MTQAELRSLLLDCLALWGVPARITAGESGLVVAAPAGDIAITPGAAPVRWFLQTPEREANGRRPRPLPSVVALLSALRAALNVAPGTTARIADMTVS